MEYCGGGSLDEYVRSQGDAQLSLDEVRILVAEIVLALEAINSFGVCHRDIKLQNLIFDTEGHLKLVDFGSAKIYDKTELNSLQFDRIKKVLAEYEKKYLVSQPIEADYGTDEYESWNTPKEPRELVGSALYAAPEMIINGYSDFETDYWALGIIIYRLIFGRYPFDETSTSQEALFKKICNNGLDFPPTTSPAAEAATDLIRKLLTRDPKKRMGCSKKADSGLTFADLKAHTFFKEVDFHKIYDTKGMKVIKTSLATPNQYGNGVRSHDNSQNNTVSSSFNSSHCNSTLGKKSKEVMAQVQTKRKKFLFIDVVGTLIIFSDATIRYDQIYDNSTRIFKIRHLKKVDFNAKTMNIYMENEINKKTYDLKVTGPRETFDRFAEAYAEVLATIPKDDEMAED